MADNTGENVSADKTEDGSNPGAFNLEAKVSEDMNAIIEQNESDHATTADISADEGQALSPRNSVDTHAESITSEVKPSESMHYHYRQSYVPDRQSFYDYTRAPDQFIKSLDEDAAFQKMLRVQESEQSIYDNEKYKEPVSDPYKKAIEYLEKHNIIRLFQKLTSSVVYTMPEAPLDVMMEKLRAMKVTNEGDFDASEITSM